MIFFPARPCAYGNDLLAGNRYIGLKNGVGGDDLTAANDDIGFHGLPF